MALASFFDWLAEHREVQIGGMLLMLAWTTTMLAKGLLKFWYELWPVEGEENED